MQVQTENYPYPINYLTCLCILTRKSNNFVISLYMIKNTILIFLVFSYCYPQKAEAMKMARENEHPVGDSVQTPGLWRKSLTPVLLIGAGAAISNSRFEKQLQHDIRRMTGPDFHFPIDDYTQYAPTAGLFMAALLGAEGKNHWFDQAKYGLMANVANFLVTHGLKRIIKKPRPYGGNHAIPSGHTSFAFTNAALLYKEYEQTYPWLAYSGYALATTSGTFRILNNKHWLSDVLVGAGLGILITELVYHFEPFKAVNPFEEKKGITLLPSFTENHAGIYLAVRF